MAYIIHTSPNGWEAIPVSFGPVDHSYGQAHPGAADAKASENIAGVMNA